MILAGLAYWLRDWRKMHVAVCVPHFLFFAYSWSVEMFSNFLCEGEGSCEGHLSAVSLIRWYAESARWLVLNRRSDKALESLHRVARINGKPINKLTIEVSLLLPVTCNL